MSACEKCWSEAGRRAYGGGRSQTEVYHEVLGEHHHDGYIADLKKEITALKAERDELISRLAEYEALADEMMMIMFQDQFRALRQKTESSRCECGVPGCSRDALREEWASRWREVFDIKP